MATVVTDVRFSESQHFMTLFDEVLKLIRRDTSDEDISNAVCKIIKRRRESISNSCAVENFESLKDLCAYFYRFSPISAGLARNKTLAAIGNCEELRTRLKHSSLNILSVGSGPGSDLVGLCSALHETYAFKNLELILVDYNESWEKFFRTTIQVLKEGNFGNASKFFKEKEVSTQFICCDVSRTVDVDYEEAFENVDIIWVKGLLSFLKTDEARSRVSKTIMSLMKSRAVLMVIDSPDCDQFEKFTVELKPIFSTKTDGFILHEEPNIVYGPGICSFIHQEISVYVKLPFDWE
ncbi:uncharacterized protein NPIL_260231 [Nephila pilipes]|uniref:Uncharacterized protein n=1 Tax=Nephila pilipes TaxID=299642 RepID=A0A8X6QI96_NEPPI|nr:uncharacterized protein NPIL_260231 [Nephila pilipes]